VTDDDEDVQLQFFRLLLATVNHDHELAGRVVDQADAVRLCLYTAYRFVMLYQDDIDDFRDGIVHDIAILEESDEEVP
jgi:hypothetical protein